MSLSLLPRDNDPPPPPSSSGAGAGGIESAASVSKASQACISCRKQKRKCDKTLPACGLCARMTRRCDYTDTPSAPTADDIAVLQARVAELENRLSNGGGSGGGGDVAMGGTGNNHDPHSPSTTTTTNTTHALSPSGGSGRSRPPPVNSRGPLWLPSLMNNGLPSAVFLDIDCFKWAGMPIPKPNVDVPEDVFEILSQGRSGNDSTGSNAVQEATAEYFDTVHRWFPFISRKRMSLGISLGEGGPDLAMLFLAMKLVTAHPVEGTPCAATPMYTAAKRFLALLESSGNVSLPHLQSMILVALYEFGHGIYPAAWMSISACSRYAEFVGIPAFKESSLMLGSVATWTEVEERRRVWWAVYILDRAVCLGNKRRCSFPEPDETTSLPVDDDAWDAGDPTCAQHIPAITTPIFQPQGPFARLAQAAMLVSNTLQHCRSSILTNRRGGTTSSSNNKSDHPFDLAYVQSLADTISSFGAVLEDELHFSKSSPTTTTNHQQQSTYFARLVPRCLTHSAMILLFDVYSCPENLHDGPGPNGIDSGGPKTPDELTMQMRAISGLRALALQVRDLSVDLLEAVMLPAEQRRVSPLCLDSVYGAMATLHWLWKEGGDAELLAGLEDVRRSMARLAMRWRLAREYVDMMDYHDVTAVVAWRGGIVS
ncbi:hypothetical protein B0T17DRAFT_589721 [Bombardia bombarda]|uniref:Zn(2)-C6 fungal-type domain-containing protein n=1 Tax=Bombardia bombarda TaxID=252184 RepID=A0AA39XA33_9PEZI|nr:hypothetical protein B0T17DRAFT_589721 [Bombardia bombarda]